MPQIADIGIRTIASVGSSILGSATSSTAIWSTPRHTTAFMINLNRFEIRSGSPRIRSPTRRLGESVWTRIPLRIPRRPGKNCRTRLLATSTTIDLRTVACRRSTEYARRSSVPEAPPLPRKATRTARWQRRSRRRWASASAEQVIRVGRRRRLRRVRRRIPRRDAPTALNAGSVRRIGVWRKISHRVTTCPIRSCLFASAVPRRPGLERGPHGHAR